MKNLTNAEMVALWPEFVKKYEVPNEDISVNGRKINPKLLFQYFILTPKQIAALPNAQERRILYEMYTDDIPEYLFTGTVNPATKKKNPEGVYPESDTADHLTITDIMQETNAEIRRLLILAFGGSEKFIKEGGAELFLSPIDENDYQHARLLRLVLGTEEHFCLEMYNQTIQPPTEAIDNPHWERLADPKKDNILKVWEENYTKNFDKLNLRLTPTGPQKIYRQWMPKDQARAAKSMTDCENWTFGLNLITREWDLPEALTSLVNNDILGKEFDVEA